MVILFVMYLIANLQLEIFLSFVVMMKQKNQQISWAIANFAIKDFEDLEKVRKLNLDFFFSLLCKVLMIYQYRYSFV